MAFVENQDCLIEEFRRHWILNDDSGVSEKVLSHLISGIPSSPPMECPEISMDMLDKECEPKVICSQHKMPASSMKANQSSSLHGTAVIAAAAAAAAAAANHSKNQVITQPGEATVSKRNDGAEGRSPVSRTSVRFQHLKGQMKESDDSTASPNTQQRSGTKTTSSTGHVLSTEVIGGTRLTGQPGVQARPAGPAGFVHPAQMMGGGRASGQPGVQARPAGPAGFVHPAQMMGGGRASGQPGVQARPAGPAGFVHPAQMMGGARASGQPGVQARPAGPAGFVHPAQMMGGARASGQPGVQARPAGPAGFVHPVQSQGESNQQGPGRFVRGNETQDIMNRDNVGAAHPALMNDFRKLPPAGILRKRNDQEGDQGKGLVLSDANANLEEESFVEEELFQESKVELLKKKSLLTSLLKAKQTSVNNPFNEFCKFSGNGFMAQMKVVTIDFFFTFGEDEASKKPMTLSIQGLSTVEQATGYALFKYVEEDRKPKPLDSIEHYTLRIVEDEEDGTPDMDLPGKWPL